MSARARVGHRPDLTAVTPRPAHHAAGRRPARRLVTAATTDAVIDAVSELRRRAGARPACWSAGPTSSSPTTGSTAPSCGSPPAASTSTPAAPARASASGSPRGSPGTTLVVRRRRARAGRASRRCPASPARRVRPRCRTSAPTARRSPRRSRPCAPGTAGAAHPHLRRRRLRVRVPHVALQAGADRGGLVRRPRGHLPARARRPRGAGPRTPSWRRPSASSSGARAPLAGRARGGARRCAGARGWCWTTPTPTPGAPAPSSPTRCSTPERAAALPAGAPALAAAGRPGQDQRRLADRARRVRPRLRPARPRVAVDKHTLALTNRGTACAADLVDAGPRGAGRRARRLRGHPRARARAGRAARSDAGELATGGAFARVRPRPQGYACDVDRFDPSRSPGPLSWPLAADRRHAVDGPRRRRRRRARRPVRALVAGHAAAERRGCARSPVPTCRSRCSARTSRSPTRRHFGTSWRRGVCVRFREPVPARAARRACCGTRPSPSRSRTPTASSRLRRGRGRAPGTSAASPATRAGRGAAGRGRRSRPRRPRPWRPPRRTRDPHRRPPTPRRRRTPPDDEPRTTPRTAPQDDATSTTTRSRARPAAAARAPDPGRHAEAHRHREGAGVTPPADEGLPGPGRADS